VSVRNHTTVGGKALLHHHVEPHPVVDEQAITARHMGGDPLLRVHIGQARRRME
jgi:hypothetical protein